MAIRSRYIPCLPFVIPSGGLDHAEAHRESTYHVQRTAQVTAFACEG